MQGKDYAKNLKLLGQTKNKPSKELECFPNPGCDEVELFSDEVSALCPKTGQPDWYTIRVEYHPKKLCIESKSFKLYLWTFREEGHFIEELSRIICDDLRKACRPIYIEVSATMKPRGGVAITARTSWVDA
jgi:7-cyano-7-deazaguanine reductase